MSIATQIEALTQDRNDIRAALVAKGVTSATGSGFDEFATDIANIPTEASGTLQILTYDDTLVGDYNISQYATLRIDTYDPCDDQRACEEQGGEWIEDGEGGGYCTSCEEA